MGCGASTAKGQDPAPEPLRKDATRAAGKAGESKRGGAASDGGSKRKGKDAEDNPTAPRGDGGKQIMVRPKPKKGEKDDGKSLGDRYRFYAISDKFETLEEVAEALRQAGLESSNLIVAIDYTKSNQWTGRHTFGGRSLHWIDPEGAVRNPYMIATEVIGKVLSVYDDDNLIPVFGFGDSTTLDRSVFPFFPDRPARGFEEMLLRYKELTPRVVMAGPTNFAPAIDAAAAIVAQTRMYHILLIIADGQVTNRAHTEAAIVRASELPLSIVVVGVGDGPWDAMEEFDDNLPDRKFDNFQFVQMNKVMEENPSNAEVAFAIAALMEIPEQFMAIRSLGYIG